mgnify:CR=1 FL=1
MAGRPDVEDDSYQVDAVISLFAIMLVILLTLTAAAARSDNDTPSDYRRAERAETPFILRSIQAPFLTRTYWRADAAGLARIDLAAVVDRLEPAGEPSASLAAPGLDITFDRNAVEPGGFRLSLLFHDPGAAAWAFAEPIDWDERERLAAWARDRRSAFLFVAPSAAVRLPALDAATRRGAKPFGLALLPSETAPIVLNRSGAGAVHASILRAQ